VDALGQNIYSSLKKKKDRIKQVLRVGELWKRLALDKYDVD
jgi:hypothetical protein